MFQEGPPENHPGFLQIVVKPFFTVTEYERGVGFERQVLNGTFPGSGYHLVTVH